MPDPDVRPTRGTAYPPPQSIPEPPPGDFTLSLGDIPGCEYSINRLNAAIDRLGVEIDALTAKRTASLGHGLLASLPALDRKIADARARVAYLNESIPVCTEKLAEFERKHAALQTALDAEAATLRADVAAWRADYDLRYPALAAPLAALLEAGFLLKVRQDALTRKAQRGSLGKLSNLDCGPHVPDTVTRAMLPAPHGRPGQPFFDHRRRLPMSDIPHGFSVFQE